MEISKEHMDQLLEAKTLLENPGFVAKVTDLIGTPIEKAIDALPDGWQNKVTDATQTALLGALNIAVKTMDNHSNEAYPKLHSLAAAISGGAGGAFGIIALPFELPVSTAIMLRSIADIARLNGEDLAAREAQLSCLMVFSLGGKSSSDDATESGYFAARIALAKAISEAAAFLAEKVLATEGAPAIVRLIVQIATRFNILVSQKAAATAVPIIGLATGAIINTLFIGHFQDMARGHFTVRRLERIYGENEIRAAYDAL